MDYIVKEKKHYWGLYDGGTLDIWRLLFSGKNLYEVEVYRDNGRISAAYVTEPGKDYNDRIRVENYRDAIKKIRFIENESHLTKAV